MPILVCFSYSLGIGLFISFKDFQRIYQNEIYITVSQKRKTIIRRSHFEGLCYIEI